MAAVAAVSAVAVAASVAVAVSVAVATAREAATVAVASAVAVVSTATPDAVTMARGSGATVVVRLPPKYLCRFLPELISQPQSARVPAASSHTRLLVPCLPSLTTNSLQHCMQMAFSIWSIAADSPSARNLPHTVNSTYSLVIFSFL